MKINTTSFLLVAGLGGVAYGNAFNINEHDAKVSGRAGATAATNTDASSVVFNPGGIPVSESVAISNELMDVYAEVAKKYPTTPIAAGSTFKSITGIFTYFYGFKIAPRTIDDIEL